MEGFPFKSCPGQNPVSDHFRRWYVPPGKTTRDCTYCEECFNAHIRGTPAEDGFTIHRNVANCTCDYKRQQDVSVEITNSKGFDSKAFPLVKGHDEANANGVLHVALPTCAQYTIHVCNNTRGDYLSVVKGTVGDTPIVINEGERIFYPKDIYIDGFTTGSNESFLFVSPSTEEKGTLPGENKTNIIRLTIQRWKRKPKPAFAFCGTGEYELGEFGASSAGFGVTGGATVRGGAHVDHVQTRLTNDSFERVGEPIEYVIQLVCVQSDEEKAKANRAYYAHKRAEERRKLTFEQSDLQERVQKAERECARLKAQLDEVSHKLMAFPTQDDFLLKF
jgi:hypothetical protein